MPTYEYACRDCEERLEVVQSFADDPLTVCPRCGGQLRKVFNPAGIIFKGSGYYVTDSRKPAGAGANGSSAADSGASSSGDSGEASKPKSDAAATEKKSGNGTSSSSAGSSKSSSED